MADEPLTNGHDPAPTPEPPVVQSLRDVAEATYDALEADSPPEPGVTPVDVRDDGRDNLGRFTAKPGEQSPQDPAPKPIEATPAPPPPDPAAPPASSNQAPAHWSEQDRQMFGALPQEGKAFLLRRHTEMEGEFTRKSQSAATAIEFTTALSPVFSDPVIRGSLQEQGVNPVQAIAEWAGFHKRAMDPSPEVRLNLLKDLASRIGIDPAAFGTSPSATPPPGLSPQDMADPAIKFFADQAAKQAQELAALRGDLQGIHQNAQRQAEQVAVKTARTGIDEFAAQKDASGKPLHPHFDEVLGEVIELFRINPQRDLREAYETACWSNPSVRGKLIAEQQAAATRQVATAKAVAAQRGNTRGITSPVSKPPAIQDGKPKTLREIAEAAADEIGY